MVSQIFGHHLDDLDPNGDTASDADPFDQTNDPFDSLDPFNIDTMRFSPYPDDAAGPVASRWSDGAAAKTTAGASNPSGSASSAGAANTSSAVVVHSSSSPATSSGGTPAGATTQVVSTAGSGLVFDNTYLASCTASYEACIVAAEDQLETLIAPSGSAKPDTIVVNFQEANGGKGDALNNTSGGVNVSYATLKAALLKVAPNDVLPATDPSSGGNAWYVPESYAQMLGLASSADSPDLTVTLNTYYYPSTATLDQDVINGITHELSEGGLGRIGGLGGKTPSSSAAGSWSVMDLFRYNAAGQADYTNGRDGDTTYFSANGGKTLSNGNDAAQGDPTLSYNNQYNSNGTLNNSGDTADWTQEQVFGSTGSGETLTLTQTELDVLEALGWKVSLKQDVFTAGLGGWETATDWSTGSMPITPQDASIGGASGAAVATLNSNVTINSIATSAGSELAIGTSAASTLIAVDGTVLNTEDTSSVASGNLGKIDVIGGSALQIGGTFDNAGTLAIGATPSGKGAGTVGDLYIDDTSGPATLNGGGTVDLGQAANASQSLVQTTGKILNAPGSSSDGLINVNDTITGGGAIKLGSFDNQANGNVEASQAGGALDVSATTLKNEGVMQAETGATLRLGADGATETLTNTGNGTTTGAVLVDTNARLAISGNLTAAGAGGIALKGAGADIVSDGVGATTFTNTGTIALEPSLSSPGAYSGQIGDQGVLSVNDLTFVNNGTTFATGSGNTLTINTGANTITDGSAGELVAESSATLALVSNVSNKGDVLAGTSSSSSSGATTGVVDLGKDGGVGSMSNTGVVGVYAGSRLAISGAYTITGGNIDLKGAGADITSDGKGPATFTNASAVSETASGQIGDQGVLSVNDLTFVNNFTTLVSGSGDTLTVNTGANTITNGSVGELDAESSATLALVSNVSNSGDILAGTSSTSSAGATTGVVDLGQDGGVGSMSNTGVVGVYAGSDLAISGAYTISGGTIDLKGAGADITSDGKGLATFTNASAISATATGQIGDEGVKTANDLTFVNKGSVIASGASVTLTINTGGNAINDGGGTLEAESGATLKIMSAVHTAQGGIVEAGSGGTVILSAAVGSGGVASSTPGEVEIAGGVVEMQAGSSIGVPIAFTAGGTLDLIADTAVTVSGSNGAISAASGDTVTLTSGTGDTVTGAGFTLDAANGTGVTVGGNGSNGMNDVVNGSGATVGVQASSDVTVAGSSDTVSMGAMSDLWLYGSSDIVDAGMNDLLFDGGSSTQFKVGGNVGGLEIVAFDSHVIIDLLNGAGSYASAGAAFAAVKNDGFGGSLLSLGADGSIDLRGVAPTSLSAANFKIG